MRTLILWLLLTPSVLANPFTVEAGNPNADYQDLQVALDNVPSGSTLLLRSDFSGDFLITQSVKLIGDGPGGGEVYVFGSLSAPSANFIDVHVRNLNIDALGSIVGFALDTGKANRWLIDQCEIRADPTGYGAVVWDDTVATFTACVLWGPDYDQSPLDETALASWPDSDGATYLKDCELRTLTGRAGEVFTGALAYYSNTELHGDIFGTITELTDDLDLREWSFNIGSEAQLTATGTALAPSLLFVSLALPVAPVMTSVGYWQLGTPNWRIPVAYDAAGQWTLNTDLPMDPSLVGVSLSFQALDLAAGSLSCLEAGIIGS